jgi:UDP-N-acetylmuramoylalanine--D-glutamate ligase
MAKLITILGGGESGIGSAILAKKEGFNVFLSDNALVGDQFKKELVEGEFDFEEGGHSDDRVLKSDIIIKSPGIPDSVELVVKAKEMGIEVISEPEFASRYFDGKIIAITGTNGKTTTTLLTYHLLKEYGLNVGLAGNVGISFARQVANKAFDFYVLELSSFQLDGIISFHPHISVILNITPDHMDRYENSMDLYAASKLSITKNQGLKDYCVYNYDDDRLRDVFDKEVKFQTRSFSLNNTSDAFLKNEYFVEFKSINNEILKLSDSPLIGKHNIYNTMAAMLSAKLMGLEFKTLLKSLKTFKNVEHRLESVEKINGVEFINDSKATNVEAVYYALEGVKSPIIWIAGGVDKGNDYSKLFPFLPKIKALLCLGNDNSKLNKAFENKIATIKEYTDLNTLLKDAKSMAEENDTVLLSPACASFDLFKNYIDRGNQFKKAVKALAKINADQI